MHYKGKSSDWRSKHNSQRQNCPLEHNVLSPKRYWKVWMRRGGELHNRLGVVNKLFFFFLRPKDAVKALDSDNLISVLWKITSGVFSPSFFFFFDYFHIWHIDIPKAEVIQFQGTSEYSRVHGLGTQTKDWILGPSRGVGVRNSVDLGLM